MDNIVVSSDKFRLDIPFIHRFLKDSYWAKGIPLEVVEKSIQHSLCFGVYLGDRQIGFARVVTDYATFGFLSDVFIDEAYRGKGAGRKLIKYIREFPELAWLRRWHLVTKDAQTLYREFEFSPLEFPIQHMEITFKDIYQKKL